jgi:hypothetical protein
MLCGFGKTPYCIALTNRSVLSDSAYGQKVLHGRRTSQMIGRRSYILQDSHLSSIACEIRFGTCITKEQIAFKSTFLAVVRKQADVMSVSG